MNKENIDASSPEPWPRLGDVLFQAGEDWIYNACLNFTHKTWELYASGYKEAANRLVDQILETKQGMDLLIYPIVFLYRHYLELRLKEVIITGRELLDYSTDLQEVLKLEHRLDLLWISCRKLLEEIWPQKCTVELNAVEDCISQFSKMDPKSMSFRYPVAKNSQSTLPSKLKHVNIRNLQEVMERISSLLDDASMGISSYLDDKYNL